MAKFSRKLSDLLSEINHDDPKYFRTSPKSYSILRPGAIILFRYEFPDDDRSEYRFALVVRNQLGRNGYTSLRGNPLLSTFRLNDAPEALIRFILTNLYRNEQLCSYDTIQYGLESLVGAINYRTYNFRRMKDVRIFILDKDKLKEDII